MFPCYVRKDCVLPTRSLELFYEKAILENLSKLSVADYRLATLLKRNSGVTVFQRILRKLSERLLYRVFWHDCFSEHSV